MDELLPAPTLADFSYRGNRPRNTEWMSLMSVATVTRSELYSLPTSKSIVPDYVYLKRMSAETMTRILDPNRYADNAEIFSPGSAGWDTRTLWNDAHIENDERTAHAMNNARFWDVVAATPVPVELDRSAQANALMAMRRREAELARQLAEFQSLNASQRTTIQQLMEEQVKGDDPRLIDFWQKAMDEAQAQNHCVEYDNMAATLGGPRRLLSYSVTLERTVTYTERITVEVEAAPDSYGDTDRDAIQEAAEDEASDSGNWESENDEDWGEISVYDIDRKY